MKRPTQDGESLADGALDTLGSMIRVLGDESFPLDQDGDPDRFASECAQIARHIENGAAIPDFGIAQSATGTREWGRVRRFFADRRRAERDFVTERLHNYRDVVEDLVTGLRQIGERDHKTEKRVKQSLSDMEQALTGGNLSEIEAALARTVERVGQTFEEQRQEYETQLDELNNRLSSLREDLVAAREEMKRDPLTDAYNRGGFDTSIEHSLKLQYLLRQTATLVMVDLDNFKQVNDTCGHAAGDETLRAVSECLERTFIRKSDIVARYGGDEFAVILNDTLASDAGRLVERFLDRVEKIDIPGVSDRVDVTCSAGYTELHPEDTVKTLVSRADQALYQAKQAGRNRAMLIGYDDPADR